jgi:hypothetical protein
MVSELFGSEQIGVSSRYYKEFFVDSDINYELRVEGTDGNAIYSENQNQHIYTLNQIADFDGSNWQPKAGVSRQYYRLNLDYTPDSVERLPIPFNHDYCSSCKNKFPNRVVWSPKSFFRAKRRLMET